MSPTSLLSLRQALPISERSCRLRAAVCPSSLIPASGGVSRAAEAAARGWDQDSARAGEEQRQPLKIHVEERA